MQIGGGNILMDRLCRSGCIDATVLSSKILKQAFITLFTHIYYLLIFVMFYLIQMIVDIIHPGRANVPKSELQEVVGGMHKADAKLVCLFGFRTKYGGGKSTGFCVIYDNEDALRKFEPKHRLVRLGLQERTEQSRKAIKEAKNKGKKIRGTGASIAKHKAKRAAQND